MQGHRKGVATLIKRESPYAVAVHCYAHSLNLCLQRKLIFIRDALEILREISKLIKFRASLFSKVLAQPENSGLTIKPLCLTRWIVRHVAIEAVLKDYTTYNYYTALDYNGHHFNTIYIIHF